MIRRCLGLVLFVLGGVIEQQEKVFKGYSCGAPFEARLFLSCAFSSGEIIAPSPHAYVQDFVG